MPTRCSSMPSVVTHSGLTTCRTYGLQCVEIDDYEEIGEILEAVERRLAMASVMLSGSFPDTHEAADTVERARIEAVAQAVGWMLAKHNFRFVSGFGAVVGSAGLSGGLEEYNTQETPNFERSLLLRPFPQRIPEGWERQAYYRPLPRRYRHGSRYLRVHRESEGRRREAGSRGRRGSGVRNRHSCQALSGSHRSHWWRRPRDLAARRCRLRPASRGFTKRPFRRHQRRRRFT